MNNVQAFTKTILAAIGIFFTIRIIGQMVIPLALPFTAAQFSAKSLCLVIVWLAVLGLCLAAVCYLFLYKREELARRIVGVERLPQPKIQWLPAAFRLICVFAGLYCLFYTLASAFGILHRLHLYLSYQGANRVPEYLGRLVTPEHVISWVLTLAAGVYLLWGAPHFVRWQVKKTLEQCKEPQVEGE